MEIELCSNDRHSYALAHVRMNEPRAPFVQAVIHDTHGDTHLRRSDVVIIQKADIQTIGDKCITSRWIKVVNLCNHDIVIYDSDTIVASIGPSGIVVRVDSSYEAKYDVSGIPIVHEKFHYSRSAIPRPQPRTIYIVSGRCKLIARDREDVYYPADLVLDGRRIIGCRALASANKNL